jgi:hypothetical protein
MPDDYLSLTKRERFEVLDAVSRRIGIAPAILEKDYWVCRTLGAIFELPGIGEHLVFKGGTSLSKVFRLIDRFSEDVDVSLHREFLGFGPQKDPEAATGKEQRRRMEGLQQACTECIRDRLEPALRVAMQNQIGDGEWSIEIASDDPQTLLFHYPQAGAVRLNYVLPSVRIELGARSDHWPQSRHEVHSLIGESLNRPMGQATVQALAATRTFWEKATILHAEAHRDISQPVPARYARHYHDLARLAESSVVLEEALANGELRRRVVAHKSTYFRSAWARYDLATPATFRLVPPAARIAELQRDHQSMKQMFFSPPPSLDMVLAKLGSVEHRIRLLPD